MLSGSIIKFYVRIPSEKEINYKFPHENYPNHIHYTSGWVGCSNPYWSRYKQEKHFLFSFPKLVDWWPDFVNEFNFKFKNIKIEILREENPVFTIVFNDDYNVDTQKYVKLIIHHSLRMLSLAESWYPKIIRTLPKNCISYICDLNNNISYKYRALCEFSITEEKFLFLDNIQYSNNFIKIKNSPYVRFLLGEIRQTTIFLMFIASHLQEEFNLPAIMNNDKISLNDNVILLPGIVMYSRNFYDRIGKKFEVKRVDDTSIYLMNCGYIPKIFVMKEE